MNTLFGNPVSSTIQALIPAALLDRRQNKGSNLPQQGFLRPIGVRDENGAAMLRALNPAGLERAAIGSMLCARREE